MSHDDLFRALALGAIAWLIAGGLVAWGYNRWALWQLEQDRRQRLAEWRALVQAGWAADAQRRGTPVED